MTEPCVVCGTTEADTYRFCSARKAFVCIRCEQACLHFSRRPLSNGTNCKLTMPPRNSYRFLTLSKDVEVQKAKYTGKTKTELMEGFEILRAKYKVTDEPAERAVIRARLAAIEELLEEKTNVRFEQSM